MLECNQETLCTARLMAAGWSRYFDRAAAIMLPLLINAHFHCCHIYCSYCYQSRYPGSFEDSDELLKLTLEYKMSEVENPVR